MSNSRLYNANWWQRNWK